MGSISDMPIMQEAINILKEFGIETEVDIVSAEFKLKKILEIRSKTSPLKANASIVFSKVGFIGFLTMASISAFANSIPFMKAGRKSSFLIFEKGAVLYFVLKWWVKMLIVLLCYAKIRKGNMRRDTKMFCESCVFFANLCGITLFV